MQYLSLKIGNIKKIRELYVEKLTFLVCKAQFNEQFNLRINSLTLFANRHDNVMHKSLLYNCTEYAALAGHEYELTPKLVVAYLLHYLTFQFLFFFFVSYNNDIWI